MINYQTLFVMALVGVLGLSACAPTRVIEQRNDDGELLSTVEVRDDLPDSDKPLAHGDARWWFEDGQVAAVGHFNNGKPSGRWRYYYPNGEIRASGWFTEGVRDGRWLYFYPDGRLLAKMFYVPTAETVWYNRNVNTGAVPEDHYAAFGGYDKRWAYLEVASFELYFEACYAEHTSAGEYYLAEDREGEVVISITIDERGVPISATTKKSELNDEALESCLENVFAGMQFLKEPAGETREIDISLRFPNPYLSPNLVQPRRLDGTVVPKKPPSI